MVFLITNLTPAHGGSITYSDLEAILKDPVRKINSIDMLLSQPEFKPTYLRNLTTVYDSLSIQYADPLNPRIILYGEDAKLILAFTCAPGDCGGKANVMGSQDLETIRWVEKTKSFEFRTIHFPEESSGSVTISEANPAKCLSCHGGGDPRPNWEPYPNWPGIYGGADDGLEHQPGEDLDSLNKFLFSATNRPRYRRLAELADGYQMLGIEHKRKHNTNLTHYLNLLNVARITDRLKKLPEYEDFKQAITIGVRVGLDFEYVFDDLGEKELAKLSKDCASQTDSNSQPREYYEFPSRTSRAIRLLSVFGASIESWFMNLSPTLSSELIDGDGIDTMFLSELTKQDPSLDVGYDRASSLAKVGLSHLAQSQIFHDNLKKCAAGFR